MIFDCEFACMQVEFEKGVEMLDIFNKYVRTTSLLDDVSMSTASPQQQEEQPEEEEKNKKNEEEERREKDGEQSSTASNSCED